LLYTKNGIKSSNEYLKHTKLLTSYLRTAEKGKGLVSEWGNF